MLRTRELVVILLQIQNQFIFIPIFFPVSQVSPFSQMHLVNIYKNYRKTGKWGNREKDLNIKAKYHESFLFFL
jgi:hypothetical protein